MYYPVFLDLRSQAVLVVGAGKVALRKVKGLVEAGARVTVVSPEVLADFEKLVGVKIVRRRFRAGDVAGRTLVFSATDDRQVNQAVARVAKRHGIPVNVADAPDECSFLVPARIQHGDLQVAISTSGRSPKLAVRLRKQIEALLAAATPAAADRDS